MGYYEQWAMNNGLDFLALQCDNIESKMNTFV